MLIARAWYTTDCYSSNKVINTITSLMALIADANVIDNVEVSATNLLDIVAFLLVNSRQGLSKQ